MQGSPPSTAMTLGQLVKIGVRQDLTETLSAPAALLVDSQAVTEDFDYPLLAVDSRQFPRQPGMAAELAAQLHPESAGAFTDRAGGAGLHALAAIQTPGIIDLGGF